MKKIKIGLNEMAKTNVGNAKKIPKMFKKVFEKEVSFLEKVLNHGAGRYEEHDKYLRSVGYNNVEHYDTDPNLGIADIPNSEFDIIVSSNVLNCIPSKKKFLNEDGFYVENYIRELMEIAKEKKVLKVLITVYNGDTYFKGAKHVKTKSGSFQANEKVNSEYYGEILNPYGFRYINKEGGYWKWEL